MSDNKKKLTDSEKLINGGIDLSKKELDELKARGVEESAAILERRQMKLATMPGYKEFVQIQQKTEILKNMFQNKIEKETLKDAKVFKTSNEYKQKFTPSTVENLVSGDKKETKNRTSFVKKLFEAPLTKALSKPTFTGKNTSETMEQFLFFMKKVDEDRVNYQNDKMSFDKQEEERRETRHKEIINVFLEATKAKRRASRKLEEKKKEVKKEEKPAPAPAPTPARTPAPAPAPVPAPPPVSVSPPAPKPASAPTQPAATASRQSPAKVEVPTTTNLPPVSPAVVAPTAKIATKAATGIAAAAAAISIAGETGAKTEGEALKKVGQIVPNDPEPGQYSYGIFGMNTKSKTIHQFAKMNPQFNLEGEPGTKKFDENWMNVVKNNPKELYDAQLKWYNKVILQPLKGELGKEIPKEFVNDNRVIAYMADRRIQYGRVMEKSAFEFANKAKTPEEFLERMTEYDIENVGKAFATYLKNHPKNSPGLIKRIQQRKIKALQIPTDSSMNIEDRTVENASMKRDINSRGQTNAIIVNNTTNNNKSVSRPQTNTEPDVNPMVGR